MKSTSNSFLMGAIVAVLSTAIGAGAVLSAYTLRSYPGSSDWQVDFGEYIRPNARYDEETPERDAEMMLRIQDRKVTRLQAEQEEEDALHTAAPEEPAAGFYNESRAYRVCTSKGFTRSRLVNCVDSLMRDGIYIPESLE